MYSFSRRLGFMLVKQSEDFGSISKFLGSILESQLSPSENMDVRQHITDTANKVDTKTTGNRLSTVVSSSSFIPGFKAEMAKQLQNKLQGIPFALQKTGKAISEDSGFGETIGTKMVNDNAAPEFAKDIVNKQMTQKNLLDITDRINFSGPARTLVQFGLTMDPMVALMSPEKRRAYESAMKER